jgi:hypothetical protein
MPDLAAAGHGQHRATALPTADGRFDDGDSAGIPPNTIQHSGDWHALLMARPTLHQGALLSSDDFGSSVERTGKLYPL